LDLAIAGEEVSGKLDIVGSPLRSVRTSRRIRLAPAGISPFPTPIPAMVAVDADGAFRIRGVLPGRYLAYVEPMLNNDYIREVRVNSSVSASQVIDLTNGASATKISIVLSEAGGAVAGRVIDRDGTAAAGSVVVFLASRPADLRTYLDVAVPDGRTAVVGTSGRYAFKAVVPGKYRLLALNGETAHGIARGSNRTEVLKSLFDAGEEIEVKEGDAVSRDVIKWTTIPPMKDSGAPRK
jgi:hypothetical protein